MVLIKDESYIPYDMFSGVWLSAIKKDDANMNLDKQLVAYGNEERCGHRYCFVCKQPTHRPDNDYPEYKRVKASYGFILGKPTRCSKHKMLAMENVLTR